MNDMFKDTFFDKFILLVKIDKRIYDISNQKKESEVSLEQIDKKINHIKETLDKSQQDLSKVQKKVAFQELELKALDLKLKETKNKFANAKNAKEYTSFMDQITSLEQEREIRDEALIILWQQLEAKTNSIKKLEQEYASELENLNQNFQSLSKLIDHFSITVKEFKTERQSILDLIPEDFLGDYIYMYKQVPNPAVEAKGQLCGACFCVLPSSDFGMLKKRKLLRCKQCYRILFIDSE